MIKQLVHSTVFTKNIHLHPGSILKPMLATLFTGRSVSWSTQVDSALLLCHVLVLVCAQSLLDDLVGLRGAQELINSHLNTKGEIF